MSRRTPVSISKDPTTKPRCRNLPWRDWNCTITSRISSSTASFFVPDAALVKVLAVSQERGVRVATLDELFKSKCLVCALRSKTRDWVDLYMLMRGHGFSMRDFLAAFREAGIEDQCDSALSRLCSGLPQRDDEGYAHLLPNPPSLDEMKTFFKTQRDALEIEVAEEALRRRRAGDS